MKRLLAALFPALALAFLVAVTSAEAQKTFVFANPSEYDTLDPHVVADYSRVAVRLNLYDNLYRYQDNPPKLEPWLAETYTVTADGLKWRFRLRKGIKFHDGTEMTADDVVYSIDRILALKKGAASLFVPLIEPGSTKAIDRFSVEFTLTKPSAIFLSIVPEIHIVNAGLVRKNEQGGDWGGKWLSSNEAGSGSYRLERYNPAVGFSATRFADHFLGWKDKYIERIEFRTVREQTTQVLGLMKGEFHGLDGFLPADQIEKLRKAENVQILEQQSMRLFTLQLNNQRPPLNDVNVRRAINYAFDYNAFVTNILGNTVVRNPAPVPNNLWGYPKGIKGYEYDLDKAKEELAKAKVKIDRPLEIHITAGFSQAEQAGALLQNGLRKLGIEAKIIAETWPTLSGKTKTIETTPDIWTLWVSTFYADPNNWVGEMYNSRSWGTWKAGSWYKNPKVDTLLDRAATTTDHAQRQAAYEEAARIVVDEAASIFIYNTKWYGPYAKSVKNIRFCPVGNGQDMRWAWME